MTCGGIACCLPMADLETATSPAALDEARPADAEVSPPSAASGTAERAAATDSGRPSNEYTTAASQQEQEFSSPASAETAAAFSGALAPTASALGSRSGDAASGYELHGRLGDTAKEEIRGSSEPALTLDGADLPAYSRKPGLIPPQDLHHLLLAPMSPAPKVQVQDAPSLTALRMASIASLVEQRSMESALPAAGDTCSEGPVQAAALEGRHSARGADSVGAATGVKPNAH